MVTVLIAKTLDIYSIMKVGFIKSSSLTSLKDKKFKDFKTQCHGFISRRVS